MFIKSPNFHKGRLRPLRAIVIHTTESTESSTGAEGVAKNWFAKTEAKASAHWVVDNNSEVQCVDDADTAWAAPGLNSDGLQFELVGSARQSVVQWKDDFSKAMLDRAVKLVAAKCIEHSIPPVLLTVQQLKAGKKGIVTHNMVSKAYGKSTHTDPGPNFPLNDFVKRVADIVNKKNVPVDSLIFEKPVKVEDVVSEEVVKEEVKPEPKVEVKTVKKDDVYPGTVRIGHKGKGVEKLQKALNAFIKKHDLDIPIVEVDGDFGPFTSGSFKSWEKVNGFRPDGILTEHEWLLLIQ